MMLEEEAVVYGLREKREFNGRLCVVESDNGGAAQPRRWVLRVLPARCALLSLLLLSHSLALSLARSLSECLPRFPNCLCLCL